MHVYLHKFNKTYSQIGIYRISASKNPWINHKSGRNEVKTEVRCSIWDLVPLWCRLQPHKNLDCMLFEAVAYHTEMQFLKYYVHFWHLCL